MNLLMLFFLGLLWGASPLFIKIAVAEIPAFTLVAGRLTVATIVLLTILRLRGLTLPRNLQVWRNYAVLGFLNTALPYLLIAWGTKQIASSLSALVQASLPIFTIIMAQFLTDDEKITRVKSAGILTGFVGVGSLMLPDLYRGAAANVMGILGIAGACACYAISNIYIRKHLRQQPPLVSAIGQLGTGAVFMLPASLLIDQPFAISPSLPVLASWLGMTLLGTVLAYLIYFTLLQRTSATFTALVTYIVPINGILLGAVVLHEPLSALMLLSLSLIFTGVLLVRAA